MELKSKSKTMPHIVKWMTIFKVLGLTSVTIINGKSVTKPIDILCMAMSIFFGIFICYFTIIRKEQLSSSKSEIANTGNFLLFMGSVIIAMISVGFCFIFRHKLWGCVLTIVHVEDIVSFQHQN